MDKVPYIYIYIYIVHNNRYLESKEKIQIETLNIGHLVFWMRLELSDKKPEACSGCK